MIARRLVAVPTLAAALVLSAVGVARAQDNDVAAGDWFRVNAPEAEHWRTEPTDAAYRAHVIPEGVDGEPVDLLALYPKPSSAYDTAITQLLTTLRRNGFAPDLHAVNFHDDRGRAKAALRRAERRGADLVIAMGSGSAAYIHATYRGGKLPCVTVCAKDPVLLDQVPGYDAGGDANIAYTSLNLPTAVLVAELRTLMPELSHLAILVNRNNVSAMETQAEPVASRARKAGLKARVLAIDGEGDVAARLARRMDAARAWMAGDDAGRGMFLITGSTSVFREMATIDAHAGDVPVVSMIPDNVTAGSTSAGVAVGVGFPSNARLAGHYALKLLRGDAAPADLPVGIVKPPDIAINFAKTRAAGLRVPFTFVERAGTVYGPDGAPVSVHDVAADGGA